LTFVTRAWLASRLQTLGLARAMHVEGRAGPIHECRDHFKILVVERKLLSERLGTEPFEW
jgi:hypothetical protein